MRYSAQRYGTWEWLDLEVPFTTDGPEWVLSSYGIMNAFVAPDIGMQKAGDGRPVLEEWGTIIHAETGSGSSSRRWTGIVVRSELQGKEWHVVIHEFPGYMNGTVVESKVWGVFVDPASIFKQIWRQVQEKRNANLGVVVRGSTSRTIGTDSDDKAEAAKKNMDAKKKIYDDLTKEKSVQSKAFQKVSKNFADDEKAKRKLQTDAQKVVSDLVKAKASTAAINAAKAVEASRKAATEAAANARKANTDTQNAQAKTLADRVDAARKVYDTARDAHDKARDKAQDDGGAYKVLPDDFTDAHDAVMDLCEAAGMEWTTYTRYSNGAPNIGIDIHYPTAGVRRDELVFEQGVNIITELKLVRDGEQYANTAIGIGAGEGSKAVRGAIESSSARMRRTTVVEDRSIKKKDGLLASMRKDLRLKNGQLYVPEIEVVDHELAPLFSWNVGDHILIQGNVPHYGNYSALHRIISWQLLGDNKALLQLRLSNTY